MYNWFGPSIDPWSKGLLIGLNIYKETKKLYISLEAFTPKDSQSTY